MFSSGCQMHYTLQLSILLSSPLLHLSVKKNKKKHFFESKLHQEVREDGKRIKTIKYSWPPHLVTCLCWLSVLLSLPVMYELCLDSTEPILVITALGQPCLRDISLQISFSDSCRPCELGKLLKCHDILQDVQPAVNMPLQCLSVVM